MSKLNYIRLMIITGFIFISTAVIAQEFPIAVGKDATFAIGAVFDGTNFLVGIQGDTINSTNMTGQFVSTSGSLVGPRISRGSLGGQSIAAFDGSNYLTVWSNTADSIVYGQFINTSGNVVSALFVIAGGATISPPKGGIIAFGDTTYMVVYKKKDHITYGQRVSKSGSLVGTPTQISAGSAKDSFIAFDGTNYLVVWWGGPEAYINVNGQFISKSGVLVGSNFVIDGPYVTDNSPIIAFDGSRYLVVFNNHATKNGAPYISARFVTTSGSVAPDAITIRDSTKSPYFGIIAFDGTNYLITWVDNALTRGSVVMGRFFNKSGVPIDTAFTVFKPLGAKFPLVGYPTFGNNKFLIVTTRVDTNFTDGDIYGILIKSSTTEINEHETNLTAKEFSLSQNYPNPFNPSTSISFKLSAASFVSLNIFNLLGREVATIVFEQLLAGSHIRQWNANGMPSGVYFYRLKAGSSTETKKLVLLR